ncbi:MAG: hypothetical protein IJL39_04605 [Clostridia bacterium]|jgi:vacuolar-type H+-ATPase subunit H|nr:hypothetical protein [Clostridia bacterium]MBQ6000234.1 hypothetical protein [Clostridia bacterium]MBQ6059317.1 hypothetical protein [Clostridia bacterium]
MAVDMLKQVGEAEAKADMIRKQAGDAAKVVLDEAVAKAKELVAASEARVKSETAQVLKEAQARAEEDTKQYMEDIAKKCEQIKSDARVNLAKAADIIVAKVVSVSG